jgi:CheY-like chemotaxis protein
MTCLRLLRYEVLSRLRATFPRTHIPVIMVSARVGEAWYG